MTREEDGRELETRMEEGCFDAGGDAMEAAPPEEDSAEPWAPRSRLPWIGALENPRVGPLVVLNESGYSRAVVNGSRSVARLQILLAAFADIT